MTVCSGSSRHLRARWEQGPAPTSEGHGQPGAECSFSGEGPADLPGRRRIHWSCTRVWWRARRSEAVAPGLAELRQTTEVMCCGSGRVCWSAALPWQDTDPIQPGQHHPGTPVFLLPVRVAVVARHHSRLVPGTLPLAPRVPRPSELLSQRLNKWLSAGLVWTPA